MEDTSPRETRDALIAAAHLVRNGDTALAVAVCDLVLREDPHVVCAWRMRAHVLARMQLWTGAIASVSRIIGSADCEAADLLSRARWYLETGQWPAAIADLTTLLAQGFDAPARRWRGLALLLRGGASVRVGLYAGALRDLSRLPAQAGVKVGTARWQVAQLRREATSGLGSVSSFPYAN